MKDKMLEQTVEVNNISDRKDFGMMLSEDILYYLPVKFIPAFTGLLSIIIITRNLSPTEYGSYSIVLTTSLLLTQITGTWISNAVLYVYPDYVNRHKEDFQHVVFKIQAIVLLPAVAISYALILYITRQHRLALIGALMLALQVFLFLMQTFLQSTRQVKSQAISVVTQSLSQITVLCALMFLAQGKESSALIAVSSGYASAIITLRMQAKGFGLFKKRDLVFDSMELLGKLFRYGMPLCIWFFATQFYTVGDRLLIKFWGGSTGLGQYASFRDLSTGCAGFLTMPLLMASHPIIISMWKSGVGRDGIEKFISRNISLLALMFVPLLVLIDLCGSELVGVLLGGKYLLNTNIMLLVVGSIFINCVAIYVQKGLEVTGNTLLMSKAAIGTVIFSFAGNYFAIIRYGIAGAAVVVCLSQLLYLTLITYFTKNILSPKIPSSLVFKLLIWSTVIEIFFKFSVNSLSDMIISSYLLYFKFGLIMIATAILYIVCEETSIITNVYMKHLRNNKAK